MGRQLYTTPWHFADKIEKQFRTLGENFFLFFELKNIDDNDVRDLPKLLNKYLN